MLCHHCFCIVPHVDLYFPFVRVIQCHSEIIMYVAAGCLDFGQMAILLLEPYRELIVHHRVFVTGLDVIDMPGEGHLMVSDHLVGYTRIVGVDLETNGFYARPEFLVPEERCHQKAVDSLGDVHIEDVLSSLLGDVVAINGIEFADDISEQASDAHDGMQSVFVRQRMISLDVGIGNVRGHDIPAFFSINDRCKED